MLSVVSIVEGYGEVAALPILIRRLANISQPQTEVRAEPPIRVHRDKFLKKEYEFKRQMLLAAAKCGENGWILLVLDADDDCPAELSKDILKRAQEYIPHRRFSVVLAKREFEAWFIAAARSLDGKRGFCFDPQHAVPAEEKRNARKWLATQMQGSYSETLDQPAFTAQFDMRQARQQSPSFRKLCKEWEAHIGKLVMG